MEENKQENKQDNKPQGHVLTRDEIMKFAQAGSIPLDGLVSSKTRRKMMKKYDREAIETYLANPQANEAKLREIMDFLITESPQMAQLVSYIPNMSMIVYNLKQKLNAYSEKKQDKAKKDFYKMAEYCDDLNIRETSQKIIQELYRYGVFFGIHMENQDEYVKRLNPDYCKIIGESSVGFEFCFDFSFFDNNEYILDNGYPKIFRKLYNDYKAGKKTLEGLKLEAKYQPIPLDISFVVKYDTTCTAYSLPPFLNIYSYIYDLDDYRDITKISEESKNYTLIGLKVPQLPNAQTSDQMAISTDLIDATCIALENSLPDNIGYFISPGLEINTVKANENNTSSIDNVNNATKALWESTGFASVLFGVDNKTQGTLQYSIQTDMNQLFPIYRQLERHWNYKIKSKNKNFRLTFIDVTTFNLEKMLDFYTTSAQNGIPCATIIPLLLGFNLTDLMDMADFQEMMGIFEKWKPLQSAYQQSNSNDNGRPKKSGEGDDSLTESGEKSRDYTEEK